MLKRMLRSETGQRVLSWILARFIQLTAWSIRWERLDSAGIPLIHAPDQPVITIFWHSRVMQMTESWPKTKPLAMLQSPHPDGRVIANAIQRLGFRTVWGSSTKGKGGAAGLRNLIKTLRAGISIGITPDGPRGPRMHLSPGVVAAARMSGAPIIPGAWSTRHRKVCDTWDRMLIACPFTRGVIIWGDPIHVPKTLTPEAFEEYRRLIETRLIEVTDQADRHFGHEPVGQAEPGEVKERRKNR